jgi:hypothetical protein
MSVVADELATIASPPPPAPQRRPSLWRRLCSLFVGGKQVTPAPTPNPQHPKSPTPKSSTPAGSAARRRTELDSGQLPFAADSAVEATKRTTDLGEDGAPAPGSQEAATRTSDLGGGGSLSPGNQEGVTQTRDLPQ